MFNRSSRFSVKGKNSFNQVHGHQVNSTIKAGIVNLNAGQAVAKRTERDEFQYVRRGHMVKVKELHSEELSKWDWKWQNGELVGRHKSSAQKKIYTVEIVGRQSKFTAIVYEGKDAQDLWEKDFRRFSRTHDPQLFGINQSAIPALIFHHELIPCAHFYTGSFWEYVYIHHLRQNMGCWDSMLWMNTTSGILFRGPDGPGTRFPYFIANELIAVPSTVDMLREDASFRFFSKIGSSADDSVLICALLSYKVTFLDDLFPWMAEDHRSKDADHPDCSSAMPQYLRGLWGNLPDHLLMNVIGGLRFDTVYSPSLEAVARRPREAGSLWIWWKMDGLVDETELDGGLIRFKLDPVQGRHVYLGAACNWSRFREGWLLQSLRIFDALDVTEGKENFFVILPPNLVLRSTEHPPTFSTLRNAKHLIKETTLKPVYLFLHPPTMISELVSHMQRAPYFWSFDKTGQSQLSEEECEWWGLPVLMPDTRLPSRVQLRSWPTNIYTALQDWQKARGFDLTTSDWAQSMGYPEWEIVGTEDHFVVVEETSDESEMLDEEDSEWEVLDAW
ncbi:hypothetical protein Moror_1387 [Moniliophthora roreri MCA 2997]|uniref:Uncharacterized protein n=1 Tax=Moniliophthora roreri (strain MCA 2997) TaxID=1381753 RepID=V2WRM3_MONRO|nr:hypothetical protein Moror_1387 [Moniliophthora roreri MCA 2997]